MTLFHTLIELFAIGVAVMSFVVSWNTYSFSKNTFLLVLGCGYFWVGILDLFHTLTYENMSIFSYVSASTTLHFWLSARYLEAFTLLLATINASKKINPKYLFTSLGLVCTLLVALTLSNALPELYSQNQGLTDLKKINEYLIMLLFSYAIFRFTRKKLNIDQHSRTLLITSALLTIIAELNFTLYSSMTASNFIIGHIFKLLSFWAIYRLLIESSLTKPIESLTSVIDSYDRLLEPTVIIDQNGIIQRANQSAKNVYGKKIINKHCHEFLHDNSKEIHDCDICYSIKQKQALKAFEFFKPSSENWLEASLSALHYSNEFSTIVHTVRDITLRKQSELQFSSLNRVYRVLSHINQAIVRLQNEGLLFKEICDIAIEHGNLKMAWIGTIQGQLVQPQYVSGDDSGYFEKMQMRIDQSDWAKGPVGIAVNTRQVAYINDVDTNPDFWPWREAANERGYAALAAVPLFFEGKVYAVFTLYSAQKNVFDSEMASLLSLLSNDISSALYHIEQAQQKLLTEARLRNLSSAVEQSADAIFITDTQGFIEYTNPEFTQLTGYTAKEVIGQHTSILKSDKNSEHIHTKIWKTIQAGKQWRGEILNQKKNGELYWSQQTIAPIKDNKGNATHYVSTSTDNTKLHEAQETIQQLAFYDPLTKLANRRLLMDRLTHAVTSSERHHENVAVFLCDLDNFKHINDSLGHDYGDLLLKYVANIMQKEVHTEDTVARLGGDEFVLVITSFQNESTVAEIANNILSNLESPIQLKDKQIVITASIGIALYPHDGSTTQSLMRAADLAMFHAKEEGKNRFQFFHDEMNIRAQNRLSTEHALREAIKSESFQLYYQPQVHMQTRKIIGFEALIRWRDEDGHNIPPCDFIPIAEESGLIKPIGDWVIRKSISDWVKIIQSGFTDCKLAINVSAYQFKNSDHLCKIITDTLDKHPTCLYKNLTIELTESTLIDDIEGTIRTLNILKALGINLSIDDFGTGYSSLNYLKRFPVDQLKIDKSFIDDMLLGESDEAIVTAVISIAQKLKMKVIAEGVESINQANFLQANECPFAQGYLYYKPMPLDELIKLKTDHL